MRPHPTAASLRNQLNEPFILEGSHFPTSEYCMSRKRARHKSGTGKPLNPAAPSPCGEARPSDEAAGSANSGARRKRIWTAAVGIVLALVLVASLGAVLRRKEGQNKREVSGEPSVGATRGAVTFKRAVAPS